MYWCETWSLALREYHRLRLFENEELRREEMRKIIEKMRQILA
jgi:hypothetical protein